MVVGGDCPSRYLNALSGFGTNAIWHNGFEQREKLEQSLRRAACDHRDADESLGHGGGTDRGP